MENCRPARATSSRAGAPACEEIGPCRLGSIEAPMRMPSG